MDTLSPRTGSKAPAISASGNELDALIDAAERAVIERDKRVSGTFHEISQRLRRKAGVGAGLGAAVAAGALIVRVLRRPAMRAGMGSGGAALGALQRLWAMMPADLRRQLPRRISQIVIGLLPTLFTRRARRPAQASEPQTADGVDLARYLGRWYEIARLPLRIEKRCACDVVATYSANPHGPGILVVNECRQHDGRRRKRAGLARTTDAQNSARLEVSFAPSSLRWLPLSWGDYWILYVSDDYSFALVGTPDRRGLWLLSRQPQLSATDTEFLIERARSESYDTAALVWTPQTGA